MDKKRLVLMILLTSITFISSLNSVNALVTTSFNFDIEVDVYAKEARYCDRTSLNVNSLFDPLTSCDTVYDKTDDSSLDASDDARESTETINGDGTDEGLYWIFWFNTSSIDNSSITNILWSYEGYFSGVDDIDPDFYYWNVALEQWVEFDNSPLGTSDSFVYFDATSEGVNTNVLVNRTGFTYFALIDTTDSDGIAYLYTDYSDFSITSPDVTSPTYSDNQTNTTSAGASTLFSLKWQDEDSLSGYIFSFDNGSGTFVNDSWTSFDGSSTIEWSNITKRVNSTVGATIQWCVYANDTSNNWNLTSCETPFLYTTIECSINADCNLCEKCSGGACVNQLDTEDLKTECSISYDACSNDYTRQGPDGFCDGSGACDTNSGFLNVSVGNVCDSGTDVNPSSGIKCGTWSDCTADACSASEYYVGYAGDGTTGCNDTDWQSAGTTYNVPNDYLITNSNQSDTCNTTNSGESASYDACLNDYTRQGPDGYCDGSGSLDTNDAFLNVSAGNVCSSGSDTNPSVGIKCGTWSDCTADACSASEYYVGYVGNGTTVCVATDWIASGTTYNAPDNNIIDTTEDVDTCSITSIGKSASYDACLNDYTRQGPDGYCDGSGSLDTNDAFLNVSAGNVCSSGTDDNPNYLIKCGNWSDCVSATTSSNEYYVGFVGNGSGICIDTDWNATGDTWDTPAGYTIDTTEKVDTCSYSDITLPYFLFNSSNASSSKINTYAYFNISLNDVIGLSHYFFEWNDTNIWVNITGASSSGTQDNVTTTQQITSVKGTVIGYRWHANDTSDNWNSSEILTFTVQNSAPTLKTDISFSNFSIGHHFNVTAIFTDIDGGTDITNYTIKTSSGSCSTIGNTTVGDDVTIEYNCTGTALTSSIIRINASDGIYSIASSELTNTYPNQLPTVTGININNTSPSTSSDLECNYTSLNDTDGDSTTVLRYSWLNSSNELFFNSSKLNKGNLSLNDVWQCRIIAFDSYQNSTAYTSASISVNTSFIAPDINWTNSTTNTTGINSTSINPTNNNTYLNFSVQCSDPANDLRTAFFCSSNIITATGCSATTYCASEINSSSDVLSCLYNVSGLTSSSYTYYTGIVDNTSLVSSIVSNTFHVNHPQNISGLLSPLSNVILNYTWVNFTASDRDSDTINYTIYNSTDNLIWSLLYNGTGGYNWTTLKDSTHYIKAETYDEHRYFTGINSSTFSFIKDANPPTINLLYPSLTSVYTTGSLALITNLTDSNTLASTACNLTLYKSDYDGGNGVGVSFNISTNTKTGDLYSITLSMASYGSGTLQWQKVFCKDILNNLASNETVNTDIIILPPSSGTPTGGGGGGTTTEVVIQAPVTNVSEILGLCGNGICESDETPWSCFEDCGPKLFEFDQIFCLPLFKCGNWETAWFNNFMILVVLGALIVWWFNKTNPNFKLFKSKRKGRRY